MRTILVLISLVLLAGCGTTTTTTTTTTPGAKKPAGPTKVVVVNGDTFEQEVKKHSGFVVVDLWAAWCGPCLMLAPIMDELSIEMDGKVKFVKIDTDKNKDLATKVGVEGIPLLILFKDGVEVDRSVGARPKESVQEWLNGKIK